MIDRRILLGAGASMLIGGCATTDPPFPELQILSAGQGSGFLPYARGLATVLTTAGVPARAVESGGSIENLRRVDVEPRGIGTAFLGTAFEAVNGSASWTGGKRHTRVRALVPMYETSFQIAAMSASGIARVDQLRSKRVGVGPAGGPAESFFNGLIESLGWQASVVNGSPASLAEDLEAGRIDALWQGASVPIPALKQVADKGQAVVFALGPTEVEAMRRRFPFLVATTVPPGTYRGQGGPLNSLAAWNFVIANEALPEAHAYRLTRAALELADPLRIHASAASTRAENARFNSVLPFHAGALRYYRERGISLPS